MTTNHTNLPTAMIMISSEISLWKVKMLRWQFVTYLQTLLKWKREEEGERRSDCTVVETAQSTSELWPYGGSQEPGSLRKGPPWAWGRAKGWMSPLSPVESVFAPIFHMLWIFLEFLNFIDQYSGKIISLKFEILTGSINKCLLNIHEMTCKWFPFPLGKYFLNYGHCRS